MNPICLIWAEYGIMSRIKNELAEHCEILYHTNHSKILSLLKTKSISCLITQVFEYSFDIPYKLKRIKIQFPNIPQIIIVPEKNIELIRLCGECNLRYLISYSNIDKMTSLVRKAIHENLHKSKVDDFGYKMKKYSSLMQEAFQLMEDKYLELKSIAEIADRLGVPEYILSREFKNHHCKGPKHLLTCLKMKHAVYLMENSGLKVKDVSQIVGFENQRRFNECFHRLFKKSPSESRVEIQRQGVHEYWMSNITPMGKTQKNGNKN